MLFKYNIFPNIMGFYTFFFLYLGSLINDSRPLLHSARFKHVNTGFQQDFTWSFQNTDFVFCIHFFADFWMHIWGHYIV